jgi:arylsulfatase A
MHLPRGEVTIAALLKRSGYATGHFGKWHLNGRFNQADQPQPGDHGFDHWFSTQNNAHPSHRDPDNFVRNGKAVGRIEGFSCQIVTDEFLGWLKTLDTHEQPFFAFVCFHEPHEPIDSPEELVALYPDAKKKGEALHYANVTNVDRAVGRIIKALRAGGLEKNTLVFFTSDNGPETLDRYPNAWRSHGSPGPWRGMKLHLTEGGIRVPAIACWPGHVPAGHETDAPVGGVDILPTLCELAGIDPPQDRALDGESFAPLLTDSSWRRSKPLFWHYVLALGGYHAAMRDGDWKILATLDMPATGDPRFEGRRLFEQAKRGTISGINLHRLDRDPHEDHDVSSPNPDQAKKQRKALEARIDEVREEAPAWSAAP